MSPSQRERAAESVDSGVVRVCELDGELVGHLGAFSVELTVPGGAIVPVIAVSNVAVLPTHRRRGAMSALMAALLEETRASGALAAVLYASEGGIYGRFGFAPATFAASYRIARRGARLHPLDGGRSPADVLEHDVSVRLLSDVEAAEALPAVFELARRRRAGEVERTPGGWTALLEPPAGGAARFCAAALRAGEVTGYALYDVLPAAPADKERPEEELSERVLRLVELVDLDPPSYRALWSFVLGVDLVASVVTGPRPPDEPLRHLLEDPRALEVRRLSDHSWLRLVDLSEALRRRRFAGPGGLVLEVADVRCPWNAGRSALTVTASGQASVARSNEPPALSCGPGALAAVYLGATSWANLAVAGAVRAHRGDALVLADRLFGTAEQPFCTAAY